MLSELCFSFYNCINRMQYKGGIQKPNYKLNIIFKKVNNSCTVYMEPNKQVNPLLTPIQQKELQQSSMNIVQQRPQLNQQKVTKIRLVCKTWTKDSYGLFDYQAREDQYEKSTEYIEENIYIVRDNRSCKTLLVKELADVKQKIEKEEETKMFGCHLGGKEEFTVLGQLIVDKQRKAPSFKLKLYKPSSQPTTKATRPKSKHSHHSKKFLPFILAQGTQPKSLGYPLYPGNIIKFGRVQYLVLQSFNGKTTESFCDSIYFQDQGANVFDVMKQREVMKDIFESGDRENMNCKICLCNEETLEDPLISPCRCKGYCGLIHTDCLRKWINNKVKKDSSGLTVSYNFTKFECEICKAPFPKMVRTQVDEIEMMKIDKPQKPYIMLQSLDPTANYILPHAIPASTDKEKLLHVISTDDKSPIKIGRANQCEIRLLDISVSRKHAEIKLVDGDFYIKDTDAKFGTLVEWTGVAGNNKGDIILINKRKPLKIQLGRTSYEFTVQDINQDIDTQ